jgi:aldehyde dehydrogenase (NAD+)
MSATYSHQFDNHFFKGQSTINTGLFIDGKWVAGSSGTFIECAIPSPD